MTFISVQLTASGITNQSVHFIVRRNNNQKTNRKPSNVKQEKNIARAMIFFRGLIFYPTDRNLFATCDDFLFSRVRAGTSRSEEENIR